MSKDNSLEASEKEEPASIRSLIIGLISGGLAVALCYFTWTQPELLDQVFEADTNARGARKVKGFVGLIYNNITGSLAGFLGIFALYGALLETIELIKGPTKD